MDPNGGTTVAAFVAVLQPLIDHPFDMGAPNVAIFHLVDAILTVRIKHSATGNTSTDGHH